MERGILATPNTAITMSALSMTGIAQRFGDGTPLHGKVAIVVERSHFIATPRHRAVVENDVLFIASPDSIGTIVHVLYLTTTETNESDNNIVGRAIDGVIAQSDTRRGSRLSGDGNIAILDLQIRFQIDITGHVEHDGTRAAFTQGFAQRTGSAVGQSGNMIHRTASTTRSGITCSTFGTGKSGRRVLRRQIHQHS